MPVSPARTTAFDILIRVEEEDSYAMELLHSRRYADLSSADHNLATELVMGVLRWRAVLDDSIAHASSQSLGKLDTDVLTALRLGTYQLGWLDRIPARAAIHESVELVKRARKRSAAPFVNAVLRKLNDSSTLRDRQAADAETVVSIASGYAHPVWIVSRWVSQFGIQVTQQICAFDQSAPVTAVRFRTDTAQQELRQNGVTFVPGALLNSARRVGSGDLTKTDAFREGRVAIQDEASQLISVLLGRGKKILDCCAAPGGKTWNIADHNPEASIVAVELHPHRAEIVRKRVEVPNLKIITADICELALDSNFDRVLVDVPCSGTGTLHRNPEIKWRLKPDDLGDLRKRQLLILRAAMNHVAPGGTLLYSTCSLEFEENESVVEEALHADQSFRLREIGPRLERLKSGGELAEKNVESLLTGPYLRTVPGVHACDGFFGALLEKKPI